MVADASLMPPLDKLPDPTLSTTIKGCLFDLDGTIYQAGRMITGAAETLRQLQDAGIPYRFVTNTTRKPRAEVLEYLAQMGIQAEPEDCLTAPIAAGAWLEAHSFERIFPLLHEPTLEDLDRFVIDREQPEALVVGDLGDDWTLPILNQAFQALMRGAELVAIQKNRYWRRHDQLILDAGAFVAALEYSSGKKAQLVGKPSPEFFHIATRALGLPPDQVVMIGDDLEGDVEGARLAGLRGVAVRTGKYRTEDENRALEVSDQVLDSVADLAAWLSL